MITSYEGSRYTMNNDLTEVTRYTWDCIMDSEHCDADWKLTGIGTHRETGEEWRRFSKEVITSSPRAFGNYSTGKKHARKTVHIYCNAETGRGAESKGSDGTVTQDWWRRPKMKNPKLCVTFWARSGTGWLSYKSFLRNSEAHDELRRVEVRTDGKEYVNAVIFKTPGNRP